MNYGRTGWVSDDAELYTHLDIKDPETRSEMTLARRGAKTNLPTIPGDELLGQG